MFIYAVYSVKKPKSSRTTSCKKMSCSTYVLVEKRFRGNEDLKFYTCNSCRLMCGPVGSYGCETWSLTLKEELRLEKYENRVLRRILGLSGMS